MVLLRIFWTVQYSKLLMCLHAFLINMLILSLLLGDPVILHKEIKEKNLNMARIQDCAVDELKELCSRCNIPVSGKSKVIPLKFICPEH